MHPVLKDVEATVDHRISARSGIVQMIPPSTIGAEIGVFTGVFSEYLAKKATPKTLFLVDPWSRAFGEFYPNWGKYTAFGKLTCAAGEAAARYRAERSAGNVEVIVDSGESWLRSLPPEVKLDWVYLDAAHKFDAVLADLTAISTRLVHEGLILGDDCWTNRDSKHFGVFRAVQEFCRTKPFEIVRIDHDGQYALRRKTR
ncbi:class I SAM-dependent methyltransferase [Pararhodobacter zhoushanensis]|uniref:Class I SAM-dependent methyltransferase n=1 Tax=Pararhodobacter zhoushanensis TaxID=2479545 RepID=A0ABT3H308_9RHOB|nr:class I SAM-dependent methyltransferase [Pararhodobacter zhoushanensis]MCW1934135.1 class I SAM-dependent methyltransferase [Pararhodobacter zhoushanensis]